MDKMQAIRYFLKLSETLSFKKTASHFGVPASSVSRSIKALEEDLGTTLVARTTRQVRLTETGEWYRSEVSAPLRAIAVADELAHAHSREPAGTVRITALQGYGELRLFEVLERFRLTFPRILCDIELTDRYLDLSTGDIDVAIRATADPPDYLLARRLHEHRFILVASPQYLARYGRPKRLEDIVEHASLGYRGAANIIPLMAIRDGGNLVMVPRTLKLVANNGMLILNASIAGEGLAFLPRWGVLESLEKGLLEEVTLEDARLVLSPGPEMSMMLLYSPQKARLGKVRVLVDFLMEELGEA